MGVERVLAFLVCLWLVAHAVHIHAPSDASKPAESVQHCDFCVALAAGAPAPAFAVFAPNAEFVGVSGFGAAQNPTVPLLASYRSRAPPLS